MSSPYKSTLHFAHQGDPITSHYPTIHRALTVVTRCLHPHPHHLPLLFPLPHSVVCLCVCSSLSNLDTGQGPTYAASGQVSYISNFVMIGRSCSSSYSFTPAAPGMAPAGPEETSHEQSNARVGEGKGQRKLSPVHTTRSLDAPSPSVVAHARTSHV